MSRKELFSDVWRAANIMRTDDGTNGINEYIEQISWMFFLKVFEDLEKRFETEAKLVGESYDKIIPNEFSWSSWSKKNTKEIIDYVDDELFPFLATMSGTPEKDTIGLIFQEVRRNKMKSASNFKDVIDILNQIDFNNEEDSHILSLFYEDLLVKLGRESGIAGEFYTPRPIVRLMVKILDPHLNSKEDNNIRILDPFCGSCGFLVESFKHILKNKTLVTKDIPILQKKVFYGYEKKSLPFLVGLMNCILHGLLTPNIIRKNSLNDQILKFGVEDKFDYVLTNPPFGGVENKQIQQNFPIKTSATELLALQQVMRRLKSNGKCGMVVPEGLLHGGNSFGKAKKELLENYNVHTIISLPSGVFANVVASGQGPKTYLIFFDKTGPTKKIWYYELEPPNSKRYTKANSIKDEDLIDCYQRWKNKTVSSHSWFVSVQTIVEKDYDMTISREKNDDSADLKDPSALIHEIDILTKNINSDFQQLKNLVKKLPS